MKLGIHVSHIKEGLFHVRIIVQIGQIFSTARAYKLISELFKVFGLDKVYSIGPIRETQLKVVIIGKVFCKQVDLGVALLLKLTFYRGTDVEDTYLIQLLLELSIIAFMYISIETYTRSCTHRYVDDKAR